MTMQLERVRAAMADRYVIERELGEGGMATVYLAQDVRHQRKVALKVLRPELSEAIGAERFLREIQIVAGLVHPHIAPVYDSGHAGDVLFYVMPYLEGETLRERLDRLGVMPVDDALTVLRGVAAALDYAHGHGVIHRDVKPSNIMLTEGGAILTDFGVALAVRGAEGARLTRTGLSLGTPAYMSPEQATGSDSIDIRSDVYALGCVAFEMLAGEPPFTGPSAQAVVARHIGAPPPDVGLLRPSLGDGVNAVIARSLAKQPVDRFESAGALSDALERAVLDEERSGPRGRRRGTLRRRVVAIAAVAVVLATATLGVLMLAHRGPLAPAPRDAPVPRQLTFEGDVRQALGSPDGGFLAYEVVRAGIFHLFVAEGDGTSPREIYRSERFACCISWAPDGSRLLIRDGPRTDGRGLAFPRLGGDPRPLPTDVVTAWSPDGERIVGWWPAAETLRIVDVATGEESDLIPLELGHEWLVGVDWSPDGDRLAVATSEADAVRGYVLWTLPLDGGTPREVLRDSASIASPHWAAAGGAIYVLRDAQDVWKVPVDPEGAAAGDPVRLAAGLSPHSWNTTLPAFTVSSDGRRLHYARWEGRGNLLELELPAGPEGAVTDWRWLTSGTARRATPRISPDGQRIAFLQEGPDGWSLWVRSPDGDTRRITYFDGTVVSPAWSPDGTRLAFGGVHGAERGVWVVPVGGGPARRVGGEGYDGHEIIWLATGQILHQETGDRAYRLLDPETGEQRRIQAPEGVWLYGPRASRGGDRVAFRGTGDRPGLWVLDLPGGDWMRPSEGSIGPVAWSRSGDTIYAMPSDARADASRELLALPAEGGEPRPVALLPEGMAVNPWNAALRPADGVLIGAVFRPSVDAWLLEGFDPSG